MPIATAWVRWLVAISGFHSWPTWASSALRSYLIFNILLFAFICRHVNWMPAGRFFTTIFPSTIFKFLLALPAALSSGVLIPFLLSLFQCHILMLKNCPVLFPSLSHKFLPAWEPFLFVPLMWPSSSLVFAPAVSSFLSIQIADGIVIESQNLFSVTCTLFCPHHTPLFWLGSPLLTLSDLE
jgi:hypothetical protein